MRDLNAYLEHVRYDHTTFIKHHPRFLSVKVLYIASHYTGGVGGHAAIVAQNLQNDGLDMDLMRVPHLPIKGLKNYTFAITSSMRALMTGRKYDIVHAYNVPAAFAMKLARAKKRILSVHGVYGEQIAALHSKPTTSLVKKYETRVLGWADMLLTDSKNVRDSYNAMLKRDGLEFRCIYGPIDTEQLDKTKTLPDDYRPVIAYVGRDSPEKGIDVLRKAETMLDHNVTYCTNQSWKNALQVIKSADVLVVPSRIESLPSVIKEAFYLNTPVVGTAIPGIEEIVTHGVSGILVPPDDPERLADAVNSILKDRGRASRFTKAGREYVVKNFTWPVLSDKYIDTYEKLISK